MAESKSKTKITFTRDAQEHEVGENEDRPREGETAELADASAQRWIVRGAAVPAEDAKESEKGSGKGSGKSK